MNRTLKTAASKIFAGNYGAVVGGYHTQVVSGKQSIEDSSPTSADGFSRRKSSGRVSALTLNVWRIMVRTAASKISKRSGDVTNLCCNEYFVSNNFEHSPLSDHMYAISKMLRFWRSSVEAHHGQRAPPTDDYNKGSRRPFAGSRSRKRLEHLPSTPIPVAAAESKHHAVVDHLEQVRSLVSRSRSSHRVSW